MDDGWNTIIVDKQRSQRAEVRLLVSGRTFYSPGSAGGHPEPRARRRAVT